MATLAGIADQLLDPLQVDDRHHADQQIDMFGYVNLIGHYAAVQPFVEQDIRRGGQWLPRREGARYLIVRHGLVVGMQIFT
ncbi:hypothetical protein D3C75_1279500 [compost metagenome]